MGKLQGKVAIVTGAARGIGKGIALKLAEEGASVVVNGRHIDTITKVAEEIRAKGRHALPVQADVSKKSEVEQMVEKTIKTFKKVDILVNNASVEEFAPFLETSEEQWQKTIDIALTGVFFCIQSAARNMVQQKYGKIINISSIVGIGGAVATMASYAAAKAGLNELTKVAARAFGRSGINVNAIAPGTIMTEMMQEIMRNQPEGLEVRIRQQEDKTTVGRIGTPEDIANLVLFLASDESSFINGQIISSDGGRMDKL